MRGLRPGLQILDRRLLTPLRHRLRVDPQLTAQRRERSLLSLYCCSNGVRGRGASMTYLSHTASFPSNERIAPSNRGIKHLGAGLAPAPEPPVDRVPLAVLLRHVAPRSTATQPPQMPFKTERFSVGRHPRPHIDGSIGNRSFKTRHSASLRSPRLDHTSKRKP